MSAGIGSSPETPSWISGNIIDGQMKDENNDKSWLQ